MNMELAEAWLSVIPSKYTKKCYKSGIKKFESWYGKPVETLIKSPEATRTVEQFYCHLKEVHNQNTARNQTNAVIQFLKFHGTEIKLRRALGVYRTVPTTRDHRVQISEVQAMAKTAMDLRRRNLILESASIVESQLTLNTFNVMNASRSTKVKPRTK